MFFGILRYPTFKVAFQSPKPQFKPVPKMSLCSTMIHRPIDLPMDIYRIEFTCPWPRLKQYHLPKVGQVFEMKGPICNNSVKNMPQNRVFPNFTIKCVDQ